MSIVKVARTPNSSEWIRKEWFNCFECELSLSLSLLIISISLLPILVEQWSTIKQDTIERK